MGKVSTDVAAKLLNVATGSVDSAKKVIARAEPEVAKAVKDGKLAVSVAAKVADHPPEAQRQVVATIDHGAKGADVVRTPPPSGGKAKASTPPTRKPPKEQKALHVYANLLYLRERWWDDYPEDGDLWDFEPSEFWSLLGSSRQDQVLEIAKPLHLWLGAIIEEAEDAAQSAEAREFGRRRKGAVTSISSTKEKKNAEQRT